MSSQVDTIQASNAHEDSAPAHTDTSAGVSVWLHWVVYSIVGYLFYETATLTLSLAIPGLGGLILGQVAGLLGLGVVAFLQWLVLRHSLPRIGWPGWLTATILGQFVATIAVIFALITPVILGVLGDLPEQVGSQVINTTMILLSGAIMGAVVGVAQWLVLGRHLRSAGWWVLAAVVGGAISKLVQSFPLATGATGIILARTTGWFLFAAITGLVLVWLLRRQERNVPADNDDVSGGTSQAETATEDR